MGYFHRSFRMNRILLPALLCIFVFSSCAGFRNAQPPVVKGISDFKPHIREGGLDMEFTTKLHNPDKLKFRLSDAELDVLVAGVRIARIENTKRIKIKGTEYPNVNWAVRGELAPLLSKPGALLGSVLRGRPTFEVSGYITIRKMLMKRRIPVKLSIPVEIPVK